MTPQDPIEVLMERPLPARSAELLERIRGTLAGRRAVYLSTPITTGPMLLEAVKRSGPAHDDGYLRQVRDEVIAANLRGVIPLRKALASAFKELELIDPTELDVPEWTQSDYHRYWAEVINEFVDRVVFADGWQLSTGCTIEFIVALSANVQVLDSQLSAITTERAGELLEVAVEQLTEADISSSVQKAALARVADFEESFGHRPNGLKDDLLGYLAAGHNAASFFSVGPDLRLRHLAIAGDTKFLPECSLADAVSKLLRQSRGGSVNVRTFRSEPSKSSPFFYGIRDEREVLEVIETQAAAGYFMIVNETVDIHDGGVSGVSLGGLLEFAPDNTPRAVETGGTVQLPVEIGRKILSTVYSVPLDIPSLPGYRYEFSTHPQRVGHRRSHLLIWEIERVPPIALEPQVAWPNDFSKLIGDKTFGLLLADACGARVPRTRTFLRRVAPFEFGAPTGTHEWWLRTAPAVQTPGHFTTVAHWVDPYVLLADEDPSGALAGVLSQEAVDSAFSGATALGEHREVVVEGVVGTGADFMLGLTPPAMIPQDVKRDIIDCVDGLAQRLGPVRIEWAHDGSNVWVLQLHQVSQFVTRGVLCPGEAEDWIGYRPSEGLEHLRSIIDKALETSSGIEILEPVGVTSHVGDLVRKAGVPTRLTVRPEARQT